ncbi:MAG: HmuY family protein [Rikenellaceae bacterium]|jgi:hypothetical protein|nr:HmuY family protein [Rikenellaceae bacterium]
MKTFRIMAVTMAVATLVACDKKKEPQQPVVGNTEEKYIDATSQTDWHYFSLTTGQIVGSGPEADNAIWGARTDWDLAVRRYNVRTNSGAFTTVNALGGVHTFDAATTFASVTRVPANAVFAADESITSQGMSGPTTVVRSQAQVVLVLPPAAGGSGMTYEETPVYIFRTADGSNYYKLKFTRYFNDGGTSGHVVFNMAKIER